MDRETIARVGNVQNKRLTQYNSRKEIIFLNLLNDIAHRSWPLPSTNWIMRQSWRNAIVHTLAYST